MKFIRVANSLFLAENIIQVNLENKKIEVITKDDTVKTLWFNTPTDAKDAFDRLAELMT